MNDAIWTTDLHLIMACYTTILFICAWWWAKEPTMRVQPPRNLTKRARSAYKLFFTPPSIATNITDSYLYYLILSLTLVTYWYNWNLLYTAHQWKMLNTTWFYIFNLTLLTIIIWRLYAEWVIPLTINSESVSIIALLILTFFLYLNLSNLLILLFLLECQGLAFVYFIVQNHNNLKIKREFKSILGSLRQTKIWRTNALFIQFWASFFGAILLLFTAAQLGSFMGILHWFDVATLTSLNYMTLYFTPNKLTWIFILLATGFMLKIGLIPFHFWKPELYRNISYLTMLIYATVYIFAILMLFIHVAQTHFTLISTTATKALWIILILSLYILLGLLFYISEFKVFLAYTSTAHLTYIATALLLPHTNFYVMLFYVLIYTIITLTLFMVILSLRRLSLVYLTDLQLLTQIPNLMFIFVVTIAAMSGLPPLLGFWAKIAIVLQLWATYEYILALHVLGCGLFLMYFYFQNYRFSFVINPKTNIKATQLLESTYIIIIGSLSVFICLNGYLIVNDLLIWALISTT